MGQKDQYLDNMSGTSGGDRHMRVMFHVTTIDRGKINFNFERKDCHDYIVEQCYYSAHILFII